MSLDDDDYSDTAPVREVKVGPYWRPPAVREAHRVQLVRAEEQAAARGSALPKGSDGAERPVVLKACDGRTDEDRRRMVAATRHMTVAEAAKVLGVGRDAVYVWRRLYA